MIEQTRHYGMKGMSNGMVTGFVIPGKKTVARENARRAINQRAVCADCRGRCHSHQEAGVLPVGMMEVS